MQTCIDTGLYILMLSWVPHLEYAAGDSTVHEVGSVLTFT